MCLAADLSLHLLTRPVFVRVVTSYFTFKTVKQNLVVAAHHESELLLIKGGGKAG